MFYNNHCWKIFISSEGHPWQTWRLERGKCRANVLPPYVPIYISEGNSSKSLFWDSEMCRKVVLCLLVALALKSNASQPDETSPVVRTVHGDLRGSVTQSRLGRIIYSFRGVGFAQPPVGNLRFKVRSTMASTRNRRITPGFVVICLYVLNEK
jgi:hypothetical protein